MELACLIRTLYDKVANTETRKKITSGIFWSFVGNLISKGLLMLSSIIVAQILGKTLFGEVGIIRSTVNTFSVFVSFGLGLTVTKYIAEYKQKNPEFAGSIIAFSLVFTMLISGLLSFLLILFSDRIASDMIKAPHLAVELKLSALMLFFSALNGLQTGIMTGFQAYHKMAVVNSISGSLGFILQIASAYLWGVRGAVLGFGANYFLFLIICNRYIRLYIEDYNIKLSFNNIKECFSVLFRFSIPSALSALLVSPVMWICSVMLVNLDSGFDEMAIFDACNTWRMAILFIPMTLSQIILPLLVEEFDNTEKYKKIVKFNLLLNGGITLVIAFFVSLFSSIIMGFYGDGFKQGYLVLIVLSVSNILLAVNNVVGQVIASINRMWIGFLFNFGWGLGMILIGYFLIPRYGALGFAYSILLSYLLHTGWQIIFLNKYINR